MASEEWPDIDEVVHDAWCLEIWSGQFSVPGHFPQRLVLVFSTEHPPIVMMRSSTIKFTDGSLDPSAFFLYTQRNERKPWPRSGVDGWWLRSVGYPTCLLHDHANLPGCFSALMPVSISSKIRVAVAVYPATSDLMLSINLLNLAATGYFLERFWNWSVWLYQTENGYHPSLKPFLKVDFSQYLSSGGHFGHTNLFQ